MKCYLCGRAVEGVVGEGPLNQVYYVPCSTCGPYRITSKALSWFGEDEEPNESLRPRLPVLSGIARWAGERGQPPPLFRYEDFDLKSDHFETAVLPLAPRTVSEKADAVLRFFEVRSRFPGQLVSVEPGTDFPVGFCANHEELLYYLAHLTEAQLIEADPATSMNEWAYALTVEGWSRLQSLAAPNAESTQAFVAMWFDDCMNPAYAAMKSLEEVTGYTFHRVDQRQFNDKICDHIIGEIRSSRFVVADCTGERHGVFFEAGFAMGMGLPVIWTCRAGESWDRVKQMFDTRQYNYIVWTDEEDLKVQLRERVRATIR